MPVGTCNVGLYMWMSASQGYNQQGVTPMMVAHEKGQEPGASAMNAVNAKGA